MASLLAMASMAERAQLPEELAAASLAPVAVSSHLLSNGPPCLQMDGAVSCS